MSTSGSGRVQEKDLSEDENRVHQKSQIEEDLHEIMNDDTTKRNDEIISKQQQPSAAGSPKSTGKRPEDIPLVIMNGELNNLEVYINTLDYKKAQDHLKRAAVLIKKEPLVAKLIYEYLKKERQEQLIINEVQNPNSQSDTRQLVELALKHDLYILATKGLAGRKLNPSDRDLLKIAFSNKSSGQIKMVAQLLLAGGPVFNQIDYIFSQEIQDQIIHHVQNTHDQAAQLLTELCHKYNIHLQFKFSLIRDAFHQRSYGFLQSYLTQYNLIIESSQIIDMVLDTLSDPDTFVYGVYFLQFINVLKLTEEYMLKICDIVEDYLENNILVISKCVSPQATASVICDFVDDLIPRFKRYQIRLEGLRENLKFMAIAFMEEVNDSLQLERLYLKKVLPVKDNLVELYFKKKEFYQDMLNYPIVEQFLRKHFNGKYKSDPDFMAVSSTLKTIKGQNSQPIIKAQSSKKIEVAGKQQGNFFGYVSTSAKDMDGVHNWFQFGIWKTSSQFRLYLSIFIYFGFLLWILLTSLEFFEEMRVMHKEVPHELLELQNDLQIYRRDPSESNISELLEEHIIIDLKHEVGEATYNTMTDEEKEEKIKEIKKRIQHEPLWDAIHELDPDYYEPIENLKANEEAIHHTLQIIKIFPFYFIIGWFVSIFEIVNYFKKRNGLDFHLFHIIDTIQFGLSIFLAYEFAAVIDNDEKTLLEKMDALDVLEKVQAAMLFLLWIKLLVYLKLTQRFGIIIRIIELSMFDIMNFLIILFILLMAFVTLFNILFEDADEAHFGTFFKTVRSCIEMILGNFATDTFEEDKELGAILVIIYMIITNVLALNLLIAILSTTYEIINDRSSVEFSSIVYQYQKFIKSTKRFTCLVCAPAPINLLVLPLQIIQSFSNNLSINNISLGLIYGFEMVFIFFPLFLILNALMIPFAYLMNFGNILRQNNTGKAIVKVILWLFIGIPYTLFMALIYDTFQFFKMCMLKVYVKEDLEKIDYHSFQQISRYAKANENERSCTLDEAVLKLTTGAILLKSEQQQRLLKQQTKKGDEIEHLETEMVNDDLIEDLTMNKTMFVREIMSKFADHDNNIDFKHVSQVFNHCKMHKSNNSNGIIQCHNYQEIEGAVIKCLKKMDEESQKEEDFELLNKMKQKQE